MSVSALDRLLRPRSIAVIGGGAWCASVVRECRNFGFTGDIWPVHPKRDEVAGLPTVSCVADLPAAPDACFIGVNREATIEVLSELNTMGAGGAVCFASGFSEAQAELSDGAQLQDALLAAAGDMPILGPNCYGFINALDRVSLWPDIHGCEPVEQGVAILAQSSNIALNLSMQRRGLPIAYLGTVGNQARIDLSALGMAVLDDPRVTALGLYIEGISDLRGFEALANHARHLGKRIVALKMGASEQAQVATVSHTASLAGSDAGARALLRRCGIAQVSSLEALLEALKILHVAGPLNGTRIASMSCSGGEASLMADSVLDSSVTFPPLAPKQISALRTALGPKVALANPLDYHTYIWADGAALEACFAAMMLGDDLDLGCVVLDYPRQDRCDIADWNKVLDAVARVAKSSSKPMALLSSLTETLPEEIAQRCIQIGVVPLSGIAAALEGIEAAATLQLSHDPLWITGGGGEDLVPEAQAKADLARYGLQVPRLARGQSAQEIAAKATELDAPLVLKGEGLAHKSEAGAVRVNLATEDVLAAAQDMPADRFLVEEMISGGLAELLIGVTRDPAHGFVLTLGAGGVLTEILQDTVSLLLPVEAQDLRNALRRLRLAPVLSGYRGASAIDMDAVVKAVFAVQDYVRDHVDHLEEIEINPLICRENDAVAVDVLLRGNFAAAASNEEK
jgi:acyl-CoA synthetase (NDP forming)